MLGEQGFTAWAKRVNLSDDAQSTIAQVRNSDPARRAGGGRSNITGRYPGRKMGVTIQFESSSYAGLLRDPYRQRQMGVVRRLALFEKA
jgi:hypothetical protein